MSEVTVDITTKVTRDTVVHFFNIGIGENKNCLSTKSIYSKKPFLAKTFSGQKVTVTLPDGLYNVFAFEDIGNDSKLHLDKFPAIGWYKTGVFRLGEFSVPTNKNIEISLAASHPFPLEEKTGPNGGSFKKIKGYNVIHLKGNHKERGFDHGYLAATQIVDFFRLYFLDAIMPPDLYKEKALKYMEESFKLDQHLVEESKAVIEGMKDSGADLFLPEIQRDFNYWDLLAINNYYEMAVSGLEVSSTFISCSQFSFWGGQSADGNNIVGRNMDGEIDIRKITVSHLVIFAFEPAAPNLFKYVSVMWPGFIGTYTGMNENGVYSMLNASDSKEGETVSQFLPVGYIFRSLMENFTSEKTTPKLVDEHISKMKNSKGGLTSAGCVMFIAKEYNEKNKEENPPAFVYEADKYGTSIRLPTDEPCEGTYLAATNHFCKYGSNHLLDHLNFGNLVSLDSYSRMYAGTNCLSSWKRNNHKGTIESMKQLLQRATHGTTEHSVIFTPHNRKIYVANAELKDNLWDAPYREFTEFNFNEVFS